MDKWQPIESAPRDGSEIILGEKGDAWAGWWCDRVNYYGEKGWYEESCRSEYFYLHHPRNPTHWMPLPEPPK